MTEFKKFATNPKSLGECLVAEAHEIFYGNGFMAVPSFTGGRRTRVIDPIKIRTYRKEW